MTPMQLMGYYQRKRRNGCGAPVFFMVAFFVWLLFGCKETEYIPVKEVHIEHVHSHDTVHQNDTVIREKETVIREAGRGDSAMLAKYGIQLRENERMILFLQQELEKVSTDKYEHSSGSVMKGDSIPVPCPVERELTAWERTKQDYGGYALGVMACGMVLVVVRFRRKVISKIFSILHMAIR